MKNLKSLLLTLSLALMLVVPTNLASFFSSVNDYSISICSDDLETVDYNTFFN